MSDPNPSARAPLVVACAADEGYAIPLAVMGRSILESADPSRPIDLHIVDVGITPATKEKLLHSWPSDRLRVHWIAVDPTALSHLPVWGRMSIATYQRLLMGTLLPPDVTRLIWLDCDAMVLHDLATLWDTPLDGNIIAASQDLVVPFIGSRFGIERHRELGIAPDTPHFNAGVMLVNLDAWRRENVAERSFDYLVKHAHEVWFWDQEALNVVLQGRWKLLDPRWNQIASVAGRWFFRPEHLDETTYRQVVDSPWIVHWAGSIKPWKFRSRRRQHQRWNDLLDQTPWRGWRPQRSVSNLVLGAYNAWGRNLLYRFEPVLLKAQRRRRG